MKNPKRHSHYYQPVFVEIGSYFVLLRRCLVKNCGKFLATYEGVTTSRQTTPAIPFEDLPPKLAKDLKELIERIETVNKKYDREP